MLLNKDRLSHWLLAAPLGWAAWTLVILIPIFHFWLGFPINKIVLYVCLGCSAQLVVTPWAFSTRVTPRHPEGKVSQRYMVAIVLITMIALLFVYRLQHGEPVNPCTTRVRILLFSVPIVFGVSSLITVRLISLNRRKR